MNPIQQEQSQETFKPGFQEALSYLHTMYAFGLYLLSIYYIHSQTTLQQMQAAQRENKAKLPCSSTEGSTSESLHSRSFEML